MEHRQDLEAVRPRHRSGRALRLSLCHGLPPGSSAGARRRSAVKEARRDPSRPPRRRLRRGQRPRHPRPCGRREGRGRCADRRRWRSFRDPPRAVRRRPPALLRHDRVARRDPDRAGAAADQSRQGDQLDRRRRPCRALSAARRPADELRRHHGARRLAGRILEHPRVRRRMRPRFRRAGTTTSRR